MEVRQLGAGRMRAALGNASLTGIVGPDGVAFTRLSSIRRRQVRRAVQVMYGLVQVGLLYA